MTTITTIADELHASIDASNEDINRLETCIACLGSQIVVKHNRIRWNRGRIDLAYETLDGIEDDQTTELLDEVAVELEQYGVYRCRINIRPEYEGVPAKPEMLALNGKVLLLRCLWRIEDNERYHGEYAMREVDGANDALRGVGMPWIPSGDVEVIE